MKLFAYLLRICTALAVTALCAAACAQAPPPPAPAPPTIGGGASARIVRVGPEDSLSSPRIVRGKVSVVVTTPASVTPASVEVFADGRSVGSTAAKPFKVEFDTASLKDGEHTLKAVGKDANGKEVWSCSTKTRVANSEESVAALADKARPGGMLPAPAVERPSGPAKPNKPASPTNPPVRPKQPAKKDSKPAGPPVSLGNTYSNQDYGFAIQYPGKWTFKDKSVLMKPKTEGGFWVAFGEYPLEKAQVVVNVRRSKLEPGTDVDKFAKYNSYVQKWERTEVLGADAFVTTSKDPLSASVTHRKIILKDGYAWMLNCEDKGGKPGDEGLRTFESMVNSMKVSLVPASVPSGGPASKRALKEGRPASKKTDAPPPPPPAPAPAEPAPEGEGEGAP